MPVTDLRISSDLSLGLDAVTKTFAILAQRRKGKTYTASVIAEELVAAGQPWVALDPTGAWWGLRAGVDGGPKGGLPVYVLGGQHGDVPLERTAGKLIADLVVDEPRWYVLDLSAFESKEAERQFATDFAERFYRRKAKSPDPIHLFVDEADVFVPQRSPSGDQRMLGAFEAIVRRGGIRGIGTTLISQRPAVVNKNVLEQLDALIMLRVVGPNDQKALKTYVEAHGTEEERAELMGSLASLKLGEAWIWEPGSEPSLFERVQIRERHTYNSSATPKAGEKPPSAVAMADVDLAALSDRIKETVEKAAADDPKKLRKRIRELEAELKKRPTETKEVEVEKIVEVPALSDEQLADLNRFTGEASEIGRQLIDAAISVGTALDRFESKPRTQAPPTRRPPAPAQMGGSPRERVAGGGRAVSAARPPAQPSAGDVELKKKAERVALSVLIQYPAGRTLKQLAILSGYSASGGGFRNALGRLRSLGLITPSGVEPIQATEAGHELASALDVEPLPQGEELLAHWMGSLKKKAEREVLQVLVDAWPDALDREEIAERTESRYEPTGGGFRNALGKLRTLDLAEGMNPMKASDALFDDYERTT